MSSFCVTEMFVIPQVYVRHARLVEENCREILCQMPFFYRETVFNCRTIFKSRVAYRGMSSRDCLLSAHLVPRTFVSIPWYALGTHAISRNFGNLFALKKTKREKRTLHPNSKEAPPKLKISEAYHELIREENPTSTRKSETSSVRKTNKQRKAL